MVDGIVENLVCDPQKSESRKEELGLEEKIRRRGHDHREDLEKAPTCLAWYCGMRDGLPGTIVFHRPRITSFVRATFEYLKSNGIDTDPFHKELCKTLVWGIYSHEQFHFLCDVLRHRAKCSVQRTQEQLLDEEGLATAWEWRSIQAYTRQVNVPAKVAAPAVHWWFDSISAPGYCDWKNHLHVCDFAAATERYLGQWSTAQNPGNTWLPLEVEARWCNYEVVDGDTLESRQPIGWRGSPSTVSIEFINAAISLRDDPMFFPEDATITIDYARRHLTALPPIADEWLTANHRLCVANNDIETLRDIQRTHRQGLPGTLCLRGNHLKGCLGGLLLVKGLQEIQMDIEDISTIINKHKRNLEDFDPHLCAEDIGQAGYEDFLEL
jgi:hypothetical protein